VAELEAHLLTAAVTPQVTPHATPQVEATILRFCLQPRSATEILDHLGLKGRNHRLSEGEAD
jgi:hypothetical protein